jgi:hypothetical protein
MRIPWGTISFGKQLCGAQLAVVERQVDLTQSIERRQNYQFHSVETEMVLYCAFAA